MDLIEASMEVIGVSDGAFPDHVESKELINKEKKKGKNYVFLFH